MLEATETDLVNLIAISGRMQDVSGLQTTEESESEDEKNLLAEGPLPDSAITLNDQEEVDDLLSSLGF